MMEQFKIGDWVQVKSNSDATLINSGRAVEFTGKVVGLHPRNGICVHPFDGNPIEGDWYLPEELKLWEPNEGGWCWFYTSESKGRRYINPQLGRFQNFVKQNTSTYKNGYRFVTDVGFYKQCEPFIGELPSFIDKQ